MEIILVFFQIPGQGGDKGFVDVFPPLLPGNQGGQVAAQTFDSLGVKPRLGLTHRQNGDAFRVFVPPLGLGVKIAHGIQLVAEEFRPDGLVVCRRENIQNAAPEGELAGAFHHAAAAVARGHQPGGQVVHGILPADLQPEGSRLQYGGRHGAKAQGFPAHDLDRRAAFRQVIELAQPFLLPGAGHHGGVVQGQIPAGEDGRVFFQKALQFLLEPPGGHVVLAQKHHGLFQLPGQACQNVTAVDLADAGDGYVIALPEAFQSTGVFGHFFQQGKQLFDHFFTSFFGNAATRKEKFLLFP